LTWRVSGATRLVQRCVRYRAAGDGRRGGGERCRRLKACGTVKRFVDLSKPDGVEWAGQGSGRHRATATHDAGRSREDAAQSACRTTVEDSRRNSWSIDYERAEYAADSINMHLRPIPDAGPGRLSRPNTEQVGPECSTLDVRYASSSTHRTAYYNPPRRQRDHNIQTGRPLFTPFCPLALLTLALVHTLLTGSGKRNIRDCPFGIDITRRTTRNHAPRPQSNSTLPHQKGT
jgi:hypothetical protein